MNRAFSILFILAIILFGFFMWERTQPEFPQMHAPPTIENAEKSDRCAKYRTNVEGSEEEWVLGYGGRIKQLFEGCF